MSIEVGAADVPWCVPCGNIMVLPRVIKLAVQQVYKRECLLHAHCHAVGACIDYAIGIENRPIEAGVTENRDRALYITAVPIYGRGRG